MLIDFYAHKVSFRKPLSINYIEFLRQFQLQFGLVDISGYEIFKLN